MRIMVALGPEQKQAMEKGLNDSGYVLCRNCAKTVDAHPPPPFQNTRPDIFFMFVTGSTH